jgi:serine protease
MPQQAALPIKRDALLSIVYFRRKQLISLRIILQIRMKSGSFPVAQTDTARIKTMKDPQSMRTADRLARYSLGLAAVVLTTVATLQSQSVAAQAEPDADRYIVQFKERGNSARARAAVAAAGGSILLEMPRANAAAARIPPQALAGLSRNPNIQLIERDLPRYPVAQTVPYGITMVQAQQVPEVAPGSNAAMVCVIDSGIDSAHVDLAGAQLTGTNLPSSGGGTNLWYTDSCGHGTHVAGTIVAQNNALGVVGTTPGVRLHSVKVFGDSCGWTYASSLVNAAYACRDAGADVISMSLGCNGSRCASSTESDAFANLERAGILSVAAAGNSGNTSLSYPASYASVVSVAAVDQNEQRASFSQRNSQVELAAPGVGVLSTIPGGGYAAWNGTSMATPHVAGVAALIWNYNRGWTNADIRNALQASAKDLGASGRDSSFGFGLVQAADALALLTGDSGPVEPPPNQVPTASFMHQCTDLACTFDGRGSSDADGSIEAYAWSFSDGGSASSSQVSRTFAAAGTYTVTLTVTDNGGLSATTSKDITVKVTAEPPPVANSIELGVTPVKSKGRTSFDLTWTGANGSHVDIIRNNITVAKPANTGDYLDNTSVRGSGVVDYQVCETASSTCSATISVVY